MKYALLIYTNEIADPTTCAASVEEINQRAKDEGVYVLGQPLQSINTATCVRVREGKTVVTDGPFAETKEQLAGFYLFDCENPVEWAEQLPMARTGAVEVRAVLDLGADR